MSGICPRTCNQKKKQGVTGLDRDIFTNFLKNLRHIGEKRHSSNLSTLWIILRLFSTIGSKGAFNELKISYPTVYDMNKFDNLHFRHFRQFLCAEACAVQECQTSLRCTPLPGRKEIWLGCKRSPRSQMH